DARLTEGGNDGPTCLRFENALRSRPARASRGFVIDGRANEAMIVGLWVRVDQIQMGERLGEEPSLWIDILAEQIKTVAKPGLGPGQNDLGKGWVHVSRRIALPEGTREAIMTVGLLGATGVLQIDGLTIESVPRGGEPTTGLLLNGDLELGDHDPTGWVIESG